MSEVNFVYVFLFFFFTFFFSEKIKRNQSLTKDEIEAYWRAKKKTEEEHLKAVSSPSDSVQRQV